MAGRRRTRRSRGAGGEVRGMNFYFHSFLGNEPISFTNRLKNYFYLSRLM